MSRVVLSAFFLLASASLALTQTPPAGGQPAAPAARPMTLTTPALPDGDPIPAKYTQAGEQVSPALQLDQHAGRHAELRAAHARSGRRPQQDDRRSGALGGLEHPGDGDRPSRRRADRARSCPTAAGRSAPAGRCIAAPARRRPVRCITTRSRSTRSTPSSTCRPAPTPSRRARTS